jgi:hypothetical protein
VPRSMGYSASGERRVSCPLRELHPAADVRQRPQMSGVYHSYHGNVWTSTESTPGRCSAIGVQVSPASDETYTCPALVPK